MGKRLERRADPMEGLECLDGKETKVQFRV